QNRIFSQKSYPPAGRSERFGGNVGLLLPGRGTPFTTTSQRQRVQPLGEAWPQEAIVARGTIEGDVNVGEASPLRQLVAVMRAGAGAATLRASGAVEVKLDLAAGQPIGPEHFAVGSMFGLPGRPLLLRGFGTGNRRRCGQDVAGRMAIQRIETPALGD